MDPKKCQIENDQMNPKEPKEINGQKIQVASLEHGHNQEITNLSYNTYTNCTVSPRTVRLPRKGKPENRNEETFENSNRDSLNSMTNSPSLSTNGTNGNGTGQVVLPYFNCSPLHMSVFPSPSRHMSHGHNTPYGHQNGPNRHIYTSSDHLTNEDIIQKEEEMYSRFLEEIITTRVGMHDLQGRTKINKKGEIYTPGSSNWDWWEFKSKKCGSGRPKNSKSRPGQRHAWNGNEEEDGETENDHKKQDDDQDDNDQDYNENDETSENFYCSKFFIDNDQLHKNILKSKSSRNMSYYEYMSNVKLHDRVALNDLLSKGCKGLSDVFYFSGDTDINCPTFIHHMPDIGKSNIYRHYLDQVAAVYDVFHRDEYSQMLYLRNIMKVDIDKVEKRTISNEEMSRRATYMFDSLYEYEFNEKENERTTIEHFIGEQGDSILLEREDCTTNSGSTLRKISSYLVRLALRKAVHITTAYMRKARLLELDFQNSFSNGNSPNGPLGPNSIKESVLHFSKNPSIRSCLKKALIIPNGMQNCMVTFYVMCSYDPIAKRFYMNPNFYYEESTLSESLSVCFPKEWQSLLVQIRKSCTEFSKLKKYQLLLITTYIVTQLLMKNMDRLMLMHNKDTSDHMLVFKRILSQSAEFHMDLIKRYGLHQDVCSILPLIVKISSVNLFKVPEALFRAWSEDLHTSNVDKGKEKEGVLGKSTSNSPEIGTRDGSILVIEDDDNSSDCVIISPVTSVKASSSSSSRKMSAQNRRKGTGHSGIHPYKNAIGIGSEQTNDQTRQNTFWDNLNAKEIKNKNDVDQVFQGINKSQVDRISMNQPAPAFFGAFGAYASNLNSQTVPEGNYGGNMNCGYGQMPYNTYNYPYTIPHTIPGCSFPLNYLGTAVPPRLAISGPPDVTQNDVNLFSGQNTTLPGGIPQMSYGAMLPYHYPVYPNGMGLGLQPTPSHNFNITENLVDAIAEKVTAKLKNTGPSSSDIYKEKFEQLSGKYNKLVEVNKNLQKELVKKGGDG